MTMLLQNYLNYIIGVITIIKKDFLQWVRNIELILTGLLGPLMVYFIFNYIIKMSTQTQFSLDTFALAGAIYLISLYTSFYWVAEPLYSEGKNKTYIKLLLVPIRPSFIIVGKLLSGFLKTILVSFILFTILFLFTSNFFTLNILAIYFLILLILSANSLGLLIAGIVSSYPIYATISGFLGILSVIFAGAFIKITPDNIILIIGNFFPTTYSYRAFYEALTNSRLSVINVIITHIFPLIAIIIGTYLHSKRIYRSN